MTILPWLNPVWDDLQNRVRKNSLPHALLFVGGRGFGKVALAKQLAHSLLCGSPGADGVACGTCQGCMLLAAGSHPDFRFVEPEEEGKVIPIDTIRSVTGFLALKGQYSGRQIVIIHPAEAMNRFAANSLLKTLEEPTPDALLILVTSQPSLLLPTIRSRCQQVIFQRPDAQIGSEWLKDQLGSGVDIQTLLALAGGAPLEALQIHETGGLEIRRSLADQWARVVEGRADPLKCAANWSDLGLPKAVNWLASWTMDLIRLKSGVAPDVITNTDLRPQLQKLAEGLDLVRLFAHLEQVTEYSRWARGQLNAQLALEDLMISWSRRSR